MKNESFDLPPVLFHVGYHKTATTWMQMEFFRKRCGFHKVLSTDQLSELITDPLRFDFDPAHARRVIKAQSDRTGLANVISEETLCSNPLFGGREGVEFAERIKAIVPDAKILITIREQNKIIASTYMQYITRGGTLSPDQFLRGNEKYGYYYFSHRHFLYDRLVRYYTELFGIERVLVVTMESFIRNPAAVLRSVARFAGAEGGEIPDALSSRRVAESPAEAFLPLLRRINHFRRGAAKREVVADLGSVADALYRATNRIGRDKRVKTWLRGSTPVGSAVRARFQGRFGESNRKLQELVGSMIDLAGDGFEMSESGILDHPAASAVAGDGPAGSRRAHETSIGDQRVDGALPPA